MCSCENVCIHLFQDTANAEKATFLKKIKIKKCTISELRAS